MVPGAPNEARWARPEPRRTWPRRVLEQMVQTAFPHNRLLEVEPLAGGLRNANLKLRLDSLAETIVLRIYEHDASLCQKEVDLLRLVQASVPVAEVIQAEPRGLDDLPPFALLRFVEGISFRDLKHSGDRDAIAQAAFCAGETLAAINRFAFAKAGWIAPGPAVTAPLLEGENRIPRFVDLCLDSSNLQQCMSLDLRDRTRSLFWSRAPQLAGLDKEARLVHGDFNRRNLLVRRVAGRWSVAAVLDWEFAVSGAPLYDLGNFLRYEPAERPLTEPHFSAGYTHAGGTLPQDWRYLAALVDLTAVCESLTHDRLPAGVAEELVAIVRANVEKRDPR